MVAATAVDGAIVPPRPLTVNRRAAELIGEESMRKQQIVPFALTEQEMHIASAEPDLRSVARWIERTYGYRVHLGWELPDLVEQALTAYFTPDRLPEVVEDQIEAWLDALGSTSPVDAAVAEHTAPHIESERERAEGLSLACDLPFVRIERWAAHRALARVIPANFARDRHVLPLLYLAGVLYVAAATPTDRALLADLEALTGVPVQLAVAAGPALDEAIAHAFSVGATDDATMNRRVVSASRAERMLAWRPSMEMVRRLEVRDYEPTEATLPEPDRLLRERARQLHIRAIKLGNHVTDATVVSMLPRSIAERLRCLILSIEPEHVRLAVAGDDPMSVAETVGELLDRPVEPLLVEPDLLDRAIGRSYRGEERLVARPPSIEVYLCKSRSFDPGLVREAESRAKRTGESLPEAMLGVNLIDLDDLAEVEGLRNGLPWLRLVHSLPRPEALLRLPADTAREIGALPIRDQNGVLHVALADLETATTIERLTQLTVRPVLAERSDITAAIDRLYSTQRRNAPALESLLAQLQAQGRISRSQRVDAYAANAIGGLPADVAINRAGIGTQFEVASMLADFTGHALIDLRPFDTVDTVINPLGAFTPRRNVVDPVDERIARLLPLALAQQLGALPLKLEAGRVVVAVADPLDAEGAAQIAAALKRPIHLQISPRGGLDAAIRRTLGRRNIGDYLVESGIVSSDELTLALDLHEHTGVRVGKALLTLGLVTQEQLSLFLAEQLEVPFFEIAPHELDHDVVRMIPEDVARRRGLLPLAIDRDSAMVAMLDPTDTVALDEASSYLERRVTPVLTTERQFDAAMEAVYRGDYLVRSASDLLSRTPEDSAFQVFSRGQKLTMALLCVGFVVGLALNYIVTISLLVSLAVVFYFAFSAYKLFLIYKALARTLEVSVTPEQLALLEDRDLPVYSVIVPMYKEPGVLPILIDALDRLDYPKTKLEILLMLEEDDTVTIEAAHHMRLPEGFQVLVVPHGQPKGKPKACNYGLIHARGEFVVLFDAEDVPEPDQLKKALIAFRQGGEQLVTVQAKLNYFNRDQNILTRWFTSEYAMWFDLLLPGLDNSGAPIPLGGTSNHFRTERLRELGGWDPFNVTEDADLGIRLFKKGYRTTVVNSTTYEEANSNLYNWIRQRSRWIKGYMQTWLVHMRNPYRLWRSIGTYPFISLQLVIAGTFFAFLMNPIFWGLTGLWFLTHWGIIERVFPGPIFYLGAIALYFGNFAFVYINVAGSLRREYHHLVKYTLLTPVYWMLMSVAAWKALWQLLRNPFYWEKTDHGLYTGRVRVPGQPAGRR